MSRIVIACLLLFTGINAGFILPGSDRSAEAEYIHWENIPLSWSDFKGKPRSGSSVSALTASAIEYSYRCDRGELQLSVRAVFIPEQSWVRPDAMNAYILAHEQLHFDITELYARKLRSELNEKVKGCYDVRKIDPIANRIMKEWKEVQNAYDRDTHHSIKKGEQEKWNADVRKELARYERYRLSSSD